MKILGKFTKEKTLLLSILMIASTLLMTSAAVQRTWENGSGGALVQTPATFTNYELAGNPFRTNTNPPFSVGVNCPNNANTCQNTEGEPAIRADKSGNFYGSSENVFCVLGGQCGGTFAGSSVDGGNSFTILKLPNTRSGPVFNPQPGPNHCP